MSQRVDIMEYIRNRILAGEYRRFGRLPTVTELCAQFNVSTYTAVSAMQGLIDEGFVESLRGVGYFVADELPDDDVDLTQRDVVPVLRHHISALREEAKHLRALADALERSLL